MTTHIYHKELEIFYFCTFTCFNWLPLIEKTNLYDKIYNWFDILQGKGCMISGYVIIPYHIHLLVYLGAGKLILNK